MARIVRAKGLASGPRLRAALFVVFGSFLVISSVVFEKNKEPTFQAIALNLGIVSISVVLLDYLWRLSGGSPIEHQIQALAAQIKTLMTSVQIIENSRAVGLRAAYTRQGDFGTQTDWEKLISASLGHVDIMGRTTFGWTRSREIGDIIVAKILHDGVVFRWLIMAVDNKYLPLLTEEDINIGNMLREKVKAVDSFLMAIRLRLPEDKQEHLQIKMFSHVPLYCGIVRIDNQVYVTHYLFSRGSDSSPFIVVDGTESAWAIVYRDEFELIWNAAHSVASAPGMVKPQSATTGTA